MAKKVKAKYIGKVLYNKDFPFNGMKVEGNKQVPTGGLKLDENTKQEDINKLLASGKLPNSNDSTYDYFFEETSTTTPSPKP